MLILHGAVDDGRLCTWLEASPDATPPAKLPQGKRRGAPAYPYDGGPELLVESLCEAVGQSQRWMFCVQKNEDATLWLPPTQHDYAAPVGRNASGRTRRALILSLWAVLICCVVIGSLLPAASPVMVDIGRLHVNDKVMHFGAYLALSFLPVIGFRDRRRGIVAGLSMFVLGVLLEGGQHFSPGRAVELGDMLPTAQASVAAPCWPHQSAR
jgi:hypothetical protein